MQTWATCKPQTNSPGRTYWSTTIPSQKTAAHEGAFMSLFTRQSGRQRVLPSQGSEDTQQQFSRARPHSINAFLPCDVTHVRKCTRLSPTLPYCERREAGREPGNEATNISPPTPSVVNGCLLSLLSILSASLSSQTAGVRRACTIVDQV